MRNSKENRKKEINSKNKTNKRNQIIRKDAQKGTTVIEFNLSKAVIMLIIIGVVLAGLLTKEIVTTIIEVNKTELLANEDINNGTENIENGETQNVGKGENDNPTNSLNGEEQNEADLQTARSINGDLGYISSIDTKEVKTGTGPFDENDEPGNDSSENNDIVRSFDQITWTYNLTFKLKDADSGTSLKGGVIKITADLPEELANIVEWDIESMKWLSNANLSEDGISLSGEYSMSEEEVTIPGNQDVIFVLKVKNAVNGTKIQPNFTFMLEGNEEEEKKEVTAPKEITVSATGRYNIELVQNGRLSKKVSIIMNEGDKEETTGRIYGFGTILQLYNENESKGLKGIEYPQGDITFDIETKLERANINNSSDVQDITSYCTPILYDYKINIPNINGVLGKDMNFSNAYLYGWLSTAAPNGGTSNREESVYDSGNINMLQDGNVISTQISDYKFDGVFPSYNCNNGQQLTYTDNIGCFSVAYFQIFVPDNEYSTDSEYNYYLTIKDNNFKANTSTEVITKQQITSDDTIREQHFIFKTGQYNQDIRVRDVDLAPSPLYYKGNGATTLNDEFQAIIGLFANHNNDEENTIYSINKLVKFDGNSFEPYSDDNGHYYTAETDEFTGELFTYKMWFVTKKDGTNWVSQEEMNNADIEDLIIYENYEDIPDNYICVGEYFETQTGYLTNGYQWTFINLRVKPTATIGQTYAIISNTKGWKEQLDRSIYSYSIENVKWPEAEFELKKDYIKT